MCGIEAILLDDIETLETRIGCHGLLHCQEPKHLLLLTYNGKANLLGKYLAILSICSSL